MDHAPCPLAVVARTINALSVKQRKRGHSAVSTLKCLCTRASGEVGEEEPFRYQEIKGIAESFYTVVVGRGIHLRNRPYPASSVVSMRYTVTDHTLSCIAYPSREVSPETHLPGPRLPFINRRPSYAPYVSPRRTPYSQK